MEDQADDVQGNSSPAAPHSQQQQQEQYEQLEAPSFSPAKSAGLRSVLQPAAQPASSPANEDALMAELPAVATAAAAQPASTLAAPASTATVDAEAAGPGEAAAAAVQQKQQPICLQDINLDDDDDDWEDQPAPYISPAEDSAVYNDLEAAAVDAAAEQSDVPAYDPNSRRRAQYDDEDEWQELVAKDKKATQAGGAACKQLISLHHQLQASVRCPAGNMC
jgi:hypothetical protein